MFGEMEAERIERAYARAAQRMNGRRKQLTRVFTGCTREETLCLKYLYACMPASDMASYDGTLFLQAVRQALDARRALPWGRKLPTAMFLDYVLFYRVNNEDIEPCRARFFRELYPRIKGKSMTAAALAVNCWCSEKAAYRGTDGRTASPMTVVRRAFGRCGEESTLAVTALRSVCIPARQCYVPRWSHCDDNHAWAEFWADGKWHYMGACEPEPVPDKGWFNASASRAMLVRSIRFSPWEPEDAGVGGDTCAETLGRKGPVTVVSTLARYAPVTRLTVEVADAAGQPVAGAAVRFEIVNYAELFPLHRAKTGEDGRAGFTTGLGTLHLQVEKDGLCVFRTVDTRVTQRAQIDWSSARPAEAYAQNAPEDFDLFPPAESPSPTPDRPRRTVRFAPLRRLAAARYDRQLAAAKAAREKTQTGFYTEETAEAAFPDLGQAAAPYIAGARGNAGEIVRFLRGDQDPALKYAMLETLTEKDLADVTAQTLLGHVRFSAEYSETCPPDLFSKYILNPRVDGERIRLYRRAVREFFTAGQKDSFRDNPARIQRFIDESIADCGAAGADFAPLSAAPGGTLEMRCGSARSRRALFVAVCRSLGIPAVIDPLYGQPRFLSAGGWKDVDGLDAFRRETALLRIHSPDGPLRYRLDYTLGRLENGRFRTLPLDEADWKDGELSLTLRPGCYRLLTANRQIDGSVLARAQIFTLPQSDGAALSETAVTATVREGQLASRLRSVPLSDVCAGCRCAGLVSCTGAQGAVPVQKLLAPAPGLRARVLCALRPGEEPSEHLLNEMAKLSAGFSQDGLQVLFLLASPAEADHPSLRKALVRIPRAAVFALPAPPGRGEACGLTDRLFAALGMGDRRLPLSVVTDGGGCARFAFSNYNVGTAQSLLDIARHLLRANAPLPPSGTPAATSPSRA